MRKLIAQQCVAAQVEGLRADLVWYRAALSHAAFCGHEEVQSSDIEAVKELVLAHRKNAPPDSANNHDDGQSGDGESGGSEDSSQQSTLDNNGSSQQNKPNPYSRPQDSYQDSHQGADQSGPDKQHNNETNHNGQWGSMAPEFQSLNESREQSFQLLSAPHTKNFLSRVLERVETFAQGKGQGANGLYDSNLPSRQPNWFKTLIHNGVVKRDQVKQEGANKLAFTQDSTLVFKKQKTASTKLHFILLDTSASTLLNQSFAQAKQIILSLAQQAYVKREKLAIMGFGNSQVKNLLASVRAPKHIRDFLEAIPAAGGTPFHEALVAGQEYLQGLKQKIPALQVCSYILSDGRISQHNLSEQNYLSEQCLFIDTESSQVKRGRGESIARNMGAQYLLANP
jgi:magnesium chelatase subunit D